MLRKIFSICVIITTLALVGFGCKGFSEEEQAAVAPITLNYWTVYNNVEQLRQFAQEYKSIRPYVTVNVRQVRYDEFDKLFVNALADDVGPDIVSIHSRWLRQYQGRLSPMPTAVDVARIYIKGEYLKETVVERISEKMPSLSAVQKDYISAVADDIIIDNQVYGLPLSVDTLALYYNVDLLDKSGVPEPPSDWAEFFEAVKKSTRINAAGDILQSGVAMGTSNNVNNFFDILSVLMMQNGATLSQGNNVTFAVGAEGGAQNHPSLQALRFYTDFARQSKEVYSWDKDKGEALEEFVRGRSVFYFGFAFEKSVIEQRAPQMELAVIEMPQLNPEVPVNSLNYWVESVVQKSAHQNEAWDFIRFIATRDNLKKYVDNVGQPSPLRAHITEQSENENLAPFSSQLLTAKNWYQGKDYEAARQALADLITSHLEPYGENQSPEQRDGALIIRAAQVIQQTY